jgi:cholesterol transport system auxiliary component
MKLANAVFACVAFLLLGSCSVLPEAVPVELYQLPAPTLPARETNAQLPALRIDRPVTSEALGGNRLLVMTADNQFQAWPQMRLATPVPLLWRDWLLDAFWRDGSIAAVSPASEGLLAPLELAGILRAFHVDHAGAAPAAVISFDATLIDTASRRIVATRRFEARQAMGADSAPAAVTALGEAANAVARELIDWTVQQGAVTGPVAGE